MPNEQFKKVLFADWADKLKNGKGVKVAVVLGAVGILLIVLSEWLPQKQPQTAEKQTAISTETYCTTVEARLSSLLRNMEGVGACHVYVTLENGVEYVYAKQQQENADRTEDKDVNGQRVQESADTQESVILIDGDNGEEGLLLTEIQPQIKGVVVVCDGGEKQAVKERITAVVTTALNISARRVCVTK